MIQIEPNIKHQNDNQRGITTSIKSKYGYTKLSQNLRLLQSFLLFLDAILNMKDLPSIMYGNKFWNKKLNKSSYTGP